MLELHIRYEGSWTNQFRATPGGEPLFTSGAQLSSKTASTLPPVRGFKELSDGDSLANARLNYLRDLQKANPDFGYRVPESFDRTVQGVLSRLVGEVRRLSDVEDDHLALRAFSAGSYAMNIEDMTSQTSRLATFEVNDVASGGAGLIQNDALYTDTLQTRFLFGFLGLSLAQIQAHATVLLDIGQTNPAHDWTPASPSALIRRLEELREEQDDALKIAREAAKASGLAYCSPFAALGHALDRAVPLEVQFKLDKNTGKNATPQKFPLPMTIADGLLDSWSLAGAVVVARLKQLDAGQRQQFIDLKLISEEGNLQGITGRGELGSVTAKGVYNAASGVSAKSNRLPFSVDIPVIADLSDPKKSRQVVRMGVLKKTGTLTFTIEGQPELEQELEEAIRGASVGPFHFGKKGVAHVLHLRRRG